VLSSALLQFLRLLDCLPRLEVFLVPLGTLRRGLEQGLEEAEEDVQEMADNDEQSEKEAASKTFMVGLR